MSAETLPPAGCNRLVFEPSPYLRQHAHNPVDWYPWSERAFERARQEDRPIFLSIGYSTCHWCHVMERESFADAEVARVLNEAFICIKVDREERPDIDDLYMTVCQMMTGSGGWPLTLLLTPDQKPFYAATYLPKESRLGRPGLLDLAPRLGRLWRERRDGVLKSAEQITAALRQPGGSREAGEPALDPSVFEAAYNLLAREFDERYGGFGQAPKFPSPQNLFFLLRYGRRNRVDQALTMVVRTLEAMRLGGIYDHLGGGFHRYSTDERWLAPHFEKMLYDQALLAIAYLEGYQATGRTDFAATAREILGYVERRMTSPEGGFYSAEDADSEGEEGKFYLWREAEIRELLSPEEADLVVRAYGIESVGNFLDPLTGLLNGENILHLRQPLANGTVELKRARSDVWAAAEKARRKLFERRETRVPPLKDDKILADWNGLMIAAFSLAAQVLDEAHYAQVAAAAADIILGRLRREDGRLLHRYRGGEAAILANLDDYAFLIWGLLELYQANFKPQYLAEAIRLEEELTLHFWDREGGGYYFTADDAERLLVRRQEIYDGALPSGNSVAFLNLLKLADISGNTDYADKARTLECAFGAIVRRYPPGYGFFLCAADYKLGPSLEVVIAGAAQADDTRTLLRMVRGAFNPNKVVLLRPADGEAEAIVALAPFVQYQTSLRGLATAYVCRDFSCQLPVTDAAELEKLIKRID